jgi:RNA-directed DNA polymerase
MEARSSQQAIAQVLTPIFDPDFSSNSFGFRPNRNGKQAVKQVQSIIKTGRRFAVDVDLAKDDFTILVKSQRAGERVLYSISRYLQNRLKLVVNTTKSHVVKTSDSKFLGFTFRGGRIQWHPKTLLKFKQQVRRLTNRNWGVSMKYQLFKISQYLRGWINYFGIANCYQLCMDLDHWIRRRVRMAYWRQWRKPRTKVRNLMKRGVHVQAAVACGITSTKSRRFKRRPMA